MFLSLQKSQRLLDFPPKQCISGKIYLHMHQIFDTWNFIVSFFWGINLLCLPWLWSIARNIANDLKKLFGSEIFCKRIIKNALKIWICFWFFEPNLKNSQGLLLKLLNMLRFLCFFEILFQIFKFFQKLKLVIYAIHFMIS